MVLLSQATGNENTYQVAMALAEIQKLERFETTIYWRSHWNWLERPLRPLVKQLQRRQVPDIVGHLTHGHPAREAMRLLLSMAGIRWHLSNRKFPLHIDRVICAFDAAVARRLAGHLGAIDTVYGYEDASMLTFRVANARGLRRIYDLPIAYYRYAWKLMDEEIERYPAWEPTLTRPKKAPDRTDRKDEELELAQDVVVPSMFVRDSLPENVRLRKRIHVAEFGSPAQASIGVLPREPVESRKGLRILFVGSMSQRKGLADVFQAMKFLANPEITLTVLGHPTTSLEFYRRELAGFEYLRPLPRPEVLEQMRAHDLLVLPSIVEGRALVLQEALASGLPILITPNSGGEDLIVEGETGFLVPIRSPEIIADRLSWLNEHKDRLPQMREAATKMAADRSWASYRHTIQRVVQA